MNKIDIRHAIEKLIKKGMSQAEIAKACGLTQGAISAIVNGKRKDVRLSTYTKIMQLFESISSDGQ